MNKSFIITKEAAWIRIKKLSFIAQLIRLIFVKFNLFSNWKFISKKLEFSDKICAMIIVSTWNILYIWPIN